MKLVCIYSSRNIEPTIRNRYPVNGYPDSHMIAQIAATIAATFPDFAATFPDLATTFRDLAATIAATFPDFAANCSNFRLQEVA